MKHLTICENPNDVALHATAAIAEIARESLEARGRFTIALCGGSSPERTYSLLGRSQQASGIDWSKTFVFFSDERFVPHTDPRSNYLLAERTWLKHVPIPSTQIYPVPTDLVSAAKAAEAYTNVLVNFFAKSERIPHCEFKPGKPHPRQFSTAFPHFDLIVLGLGTDGHTASLFPGSAALSVEDAPVTWNLPGTLPPPVERITFTFPILNAARNVIFIVTGKEKSAIVATVLGEKVTRETCPAAGVQPDSGQLAWFLDKAAAKHLASDFQEMRTSANSKNNN